MHIFNWFIIIVMPGGWLIFGVYKLYTMFIRKSSYDTREINYLLSNAVMYKKGRKHRPYVGSFISLTDDIASVKVDENGLSREFYV